MSKGVTHPHGLTDGDGSWWINTSLFCHGVDKIWGRIFVSLEGSTWAPASAPGVISYLYTLRMAFCPSWFIVPSLHSCFPKLLHACKSLSHFVGKVRINTMFPAGSSFTLCKWGSMNVTFLTHQVTLDIQKICSEHTDLLSGFYCLLEGGFKPLSKLD